MSMHHVSLKSPQTMAWCEHARTTEGRIMVGFAGMKGRDKSEKRQAELKKRLQEQWQKKHERICTYLDTFNDVPSIPKAPQGMTIYSKNVYVKILKDNGFIRKSGKLDRFILCTRCRQTYPTYEQANGLNAGDET